MNNYSPWASATPAALTGGSATLSTAAESTTLPLMNGTAAIGASGTWADGVHVHPVDTGREPALGNPGTTGWILSSTTAGVRSWVAPFNPAAPGNLGLTTPGSAAFTLVTTNAGIAATGGLKTVALATPTAPTGTPGSSGSMAAGNYYGKIVALDYNGMPTSVGAESAMVTTSGSTGSIAWAWTAVPGAVSYQIWVGTTPGGENSYFTSATNSYSQTATSGTAGTAQTTNQTGGAMFTGYVGCGTSAPKAYLQVGAGTIVPAYIYGACVQHPYNAWMQLICPSASGTAAGLTISDDVQTQAAFKYTWATNELAITNNGSAGYIVFYVSGSKAVTLYHNGSVLFQYGIYSVVIGALVTPAAPSGVAGSAGSMAAATYYSKIVAIDALGNTTVVGAESSGVTTSGATGSIAWAWTAVPGASSYQIWVGTSSGSESTYFTSATNSYTQTASSGTGGTPPSTNTTGMLKTQGGIDIATAGKGVAVAEGSNAKQGTAILASGTVVVSNTSVTATSRIFLTRQGINSSTALGELAVSARTAGTSFTITSYTPGAVTTLAGDLSTIAYEIFEVG